MTAGSALDIVVSGTESDSHTWNLVYLQLLLEDWGHRVENAGPCIGGADLVSRYAYRAPDLLVLSSVNGHGESDGLRAVGALRAAPELAGTPIVIGGKLGTRGVTAGDVHGGAGEVTRRLLSAGFSAVFLDPVDLGAFRDFVDSVAHDRDRGGRGVPAASRGVLATSPAP
ncbi:methylaspartate mutase [Streptomyces telluris]|uniref:Methylaspartate mutase n=1 Tax=Streptomyces telluris TaxID=2720021 RepID=A0A9X2RMU2_9ACTN|nr:methylaspartate mutase [Streptomyces telluris]MCQ8771164.1 methylaspartate mutase [Streptomyces telluris]